MLSWVIGSLVPKESISCPMGKKILLIF